MLARAAISTSLTAAKFLRWGRAAPQPGLDCALTPLRLLKPARKVSSRLHVAAAVGDLLRPELNVSGQRPSLSKFPRSPSGHQSLNVGSDPTAPLLSFTLLLFVFPAVVRYPLDFRSS